MSRVGALMVRKKITDYVIDIEKSYTDPSLNGEVENKLDNDEVFTLIWGVARDLWEYFAAYLFLQLSDRHCRASLP